MIIRRKCSEVKLKDLLKADPFSRELLIRYDARYQYVPVMTKSEFFDQVYLNLYDDYIRTKNPERELIAKMLRGKMIIAQNAKEEKDKFISIQVDWNEYRKFQDKKRK